MSERGGARWFAGLLIGLWCCLVHAATLTLDLAVQLDPESRLLKVEARLPVSPGSFEFSLHESLSVTSASLEGQRVSVVERGRAAGLRHWRVTGIRADGILRVDYQGKLPALDQNRDHRGVMGGMPPMSSPEGSFLPASGYWYPQPGSFFSYRVSLEVPGSQRALVAGRLLEEIQPDGRDPSSPYRAIFEFREPADGIDLMAGPWVIRERQGKTTDGRPLRLRTYFTAALDATSGLADAYLEDSGRYIERYSRLIGDYPFTEFSVVAAPLPTGFGMPTLTYLGADVLRLPFIRATSLGHEVLHNWWGNGVYPDYATGNWGEGLTTFMADYAYKEETSAAAARDMRVGWLRDLAAIPPGEEQPLAAFRSRTHGAAAAIGYGKSAMLFFMLRDEVGDAAFTAGIRRFWAERRFGVAGWPDLQAAFEAASGRSLQQFFRQWLVERQDPALRLSDASVRREGDAYRMNLAITQGSTRHHLQVPVDIDFGDRTETRRLPLDAQSGKFELLLPARPRSVRLDPDSRLWQRLDPGRLPPILRQWILAERPALVVATGGAEFSAGARALAKRFFERPAEEISVAGMSGRKHPVLLVGLQSDVDALLTAQRLPGPPASLTGRGQGRVWTQPATADTPPLAIVSLSRGDELQALLRSMPHYGAQSWLLLESGRVVDRGTWPVTVAAKEVQEF